MKTSAQDQRERESRRLFDLLEGRGVDNPMKSDRAALVLGIPHTRLKHAAKTNPLVHWSDIGDTKLMLWRD